MVNSDRTILVIGDDVCDKANTYRRQLKQDATVRYQILTEPYGGQVVERCQTQPINVILLESYFPDNRGFELLDHLQARLVDRCPPIVMIDANDAHLAKRALKAGAADYLVREEMNADTLHQALQMVCSTVTRPGQRDREQLLAVSSDLEVITGKDGYFHWVSPNFERVLGWTPAEMIARPWTEFLHPDDVGISTAKADRVFRDTEIRDFENRYRHKDGSYRWLLWRSRLDISRQVLYGTAVDITDRKQAEIELQHANDALVRQAHQLEMVNAELHQTVEELQVTEEELRYQNTELEWQRRLVAAESRRYQDLFDFAPDGYVVMSVNGTIKEANQAFAALINVDREQLVQIPLKIYIHDGDFQAFQALCDELCQQPKGQKLQTEDLHLKTLTGRLIPVAITGTAIRDDQTRVTGFRWLIQDITDRKQAAAAIAADLEDTRLLHDLSTRLITESDPQKLYEQIIDTAIALARAEAGSFQCLDPDTNELHLLAARGLSEAIIDHFDRVAVSSKTSCGQALASGERAFVDFAAADDADGSLQMHLEAGLFSAQSTPLLSRSGRFIGMFSTHWGKYHRPSDRELRFLDLLARQAADLIEQHHADTKRQQLLAREQTARAEAEQANRIKDEFLAILSHELRSPLNPILGWSKLLQTKQLDEFKTKQALATIERNAKLQTQLIDDLLDVAKILRGKLQIADQPISLASVIEAAIEVVSTAANAKAITIQADLPQGCLVKGDDARLQQVMWNLLSNAIKFTPEQGQIVVKLAAVSEGAVKRVGAGKGTQVGEETSPPASTYARITVTDTGKGIHPDFLPRLFEAFLQEDVSITRRYGGLGLGLSIVKHLVEAHGGSVTADSPGEGLGATFTIYLPLFQTHPVESTPADSSLGPTHLAGAKVLAVDDRADARELLEIVLAEYGATPLVVASAPEALEALPTFQPQVLVCDIGMPDMDGYTLMQYIRGLPPEQGGTTPAIAVTAFAKSEDAQRALNQGYQAHIPKPIEPEKLVSMIVELLR